MANDLMEKRCLSIQEAAQAVGVSRATIYRLLGTGKLKTIRVLGRRLVPVSALDALINGGAK